MHVPACPHCGHELICACGHVWPHATAASAMPRVVCTRCWSHAVLIGPDFSQCYACGSVFHPAAVPVHVHCLQCADEMYCLPSVDTVPLWYCLRCDGPGTYGAPEPPPCAACGQVLHQQRVRLPDRVIYVCVACVSGVVSRNA